MTFFSAEDFAKQEWKTITAGQAANIANQKLQRDAKVVYGLKSTKLDDQFYFSESKDDADTHRALLICVEEIEKKSCTHPDVLPVNSGWYYRCSDCGIKLQPTGWKEANP